MNIPTIDQIIEAFDNLPKAIEQQQNRRDADFEFRSRRMRQAAIGKKLTVRLDAHRSVIGVVTACEYGGFRTRQSSVIAQFKVTLTSANGTSREVCIEKLPR